MLFAFSLCMGCELFSPKKTPGDMQSKRKTTYQYFGTVCFASVYDDFRSDPSAATRFETAWNEIIGMLGRLEASASVEKAGGDIRRFNEARGGETIPISPMTAEIVDLAKQFYEFTDGAYNPAVANLVDLWGFSPRFRNGSGTKMPYDRPMNEDGSFDLPDPRYVEAFRKLSDFSKVRLEGDRGSGFFLIKDAENIEIDGVSYPLKIDLGGIAKGYGAEKAGAILRSHGYEYGYVNLGLSSMSLLKRNVADSGAPSKNMWAVNISNPDDKSRDFLSVFGKDVGVSTSGTYDMHYSIDGRDYSHIIDTQTGEPTRSDIMSVTVLGPDAGRDDALSTALCVMGRKKAVGFMKSKLKDYRIALIVRRTDGGLELATNIVRGYYAKGKRPR